MNTTHVVKQQMDIFLSMLCMFDAFIAPSVDAANVNMVLGKYHLMLLPY